MSTSRTRRSGALAAPLVLLGGAIAVSVPAPAGAAYPGVPGRIVFQSDRDGNPHLYSVNPDGTRLVRLTTRGANTSPALSPDGTRIAFIHDYDVWTMALDGSDARQVTATASAEQAPTWSPDGTHVAYSVPTAAGSDTEILVRRADGQGDPQQLTDNTYPDIEPAWSPPLPGHPEGMIAFVSARPGDTDRNVYVMDAGGGGVANLTYSRPYDGTTYQGHDDDPSWGPDGTIAFSHTFQPNAGGLPAIWTVGADGSGLDRLSVDATESATEPAWSPDGRHVAYVGTAGTDRNIAVMAADGSGARFVDSVTSHDIAPDWQEDSVDPETTITSAPSGSVVETSATVTFTSDEPGSTFECSLDGAPYAACSSPVTWSGLAVGPHELRVRAVDPVGRRDPSPATSSWTVAAPPPPPVIAPPPGPTPVPPPPATPVPVAAAVASVAGTVDLDRTRGRVPTTVRVGEAGAVALTLRARVSGRWVTLGRANRLAERAGALVVKVPVAARWRRALDESQTRAKVLVAVTSPTGGTTRLTEGLRLRG